MDQTVVDAGLSAISEFTVFKIYMRVFMYPCIYVFMYVYIYIYTYTHIYIYT